MIYVKVVLSKQAIFTTLMFTFFELPLANEIITIDNVYTAIDEWLANPNKTEDKYGGIRSWDWEDLVWKETNISTSFDNKMLRIAVHEWITDKEKAKIKYGDINSWDVSNVTDMSYLFLRKDKFNDDVSSWNTASVSDMSQMFSEAALFNGDLSPWNTSLVTSMDKMFHNAISFNGDISRWDMSSVKDMRSMLSGAKSFDQDVSQWDVSSVTDMENMFNDATSFQGDISGWNTSGMHKGNEFLYSMIVHISHHHHPKQENTYWSSGFSLTEASSNVFSVLLGFGVTVLFITVM